MRNGVVPDFRSSPVFAVAARDMGREMAAFPWRGMSPQELVAEAGAHAAGFITGRMADHDRVVSVCEIVRRMVQTGELERDGRAVLATLSGDGDPKPRTRVLVLAQQAIINDIGLPAFIQDRADGTHELQDGTPYQRYAADLVVVWPR